MNWKRHFQKLERGMSVSIPLDDDEYLDRKCSHEECMSEFKIFGNDWEEKISDDRMFCPVCGHADTSSQWLTQDQEEFIHQVAKREALKAATKAMQEISRDFNRQLSQNSLFPMSMTCTSSPPPGVMPIEAEELMRQRYDCEQCGCRYAAIGAAFFCPACGHNSARSTFEDTMQTIQKTVEQLDSLQVTLEKNFDRDTAASTVRHMLEGSLVKIVASFQRFAEATFETLPQASTITVRRNAFQRLDESSQLWEDAIGKRYEAMLSPTEWAQLKRLFQQRHLLEHQEGVVDEPYLQKSGDTTYHAGQRLVTKSDFVLSCCKLASKLAAEINQAIGNTAQDSVPEGEA